MLLGMDFASPVMVVWCRNVKLKSAIVRLIKFNLSLALASVLIISTAIWVVLALWGTGGLLVR